MKYQTIKPNKWSCQDIQIFKRGTEYAFLYTEHKWVTIGIEGDYKLIPIEQHETLAPLYKQYSDSNNQGKAFFVIEGTATIDEADGGCIDVDFLNQETQDEYLQLQQQDGNFDLSEFELLWELGFRDVDDSLVIELNGVTK